MKGKLPGKALAVLSGLAVVGAGLLFCGCEGSPQRVVGKPPPQPKWLHIVTPHNEKIRSAFQHNFSAWHVKNRGTAVYFNWIVRGTPECLHYIRQVVDGAHQSEPLAAPDLMFGGGVSDHALLAERGQSVSIDLDDVLADIPAEIDGLPTRDSQNRWTAVGLSSFGILHNAAACAERGIEPPSTWADLAAPRFRSWIALADPAYSGSTRECLMLIVQKEGWEQGWATIVRILANARALVSRSSVALNQVRSGVSLASVAVNFDGLARVADSDGTLRYVNPPGATAVTPSAMSVLRTCSDRQLAEDFVRFCLSEAGQKLWGLKAEHRGGIGETLYHYPIDPAIYDKYAGQLALAENPFQQSLGLKLDQQKRRQQTDILLPLVQAACGQNHIRLQETWDTVVEAGLPEAALTELTAPPFDEQAAYALGAEYAAAERGAARQMRAQWSALFKAKYEKVRAATGG
jgi:ABC-type Fe3+ transport system substrate-binding protein